jgi:hypothetical protein
MTSNEMELHASLAECGVPPTIDGGFAFEAALTILSNLLKTWWPETELNDSVACAISKLLIALWTQRTRRTVKTSVVCDLCAVFLSDMRWQICLKERMPDDVFLLPQQSVRTALAFATSITR